MDIDKYINEIQKELDQAAIDLYRLQGALAMLQKIKAEQVEKGDPHDEVAH